VGKSTLVNCLLGEERQEVGEVGELGQGRHTTRRRDLFELPGGAMVIDTPGMRELGMWDAESGVEQTFDDVEAVIASCRFSDCTHRGEPGCAVRAALESGELDGERWESYLKLKAENEEAAEKARRIAAKQEKFRQNVRTGKYGGKGGTKSGGKKRR
jgi:ribosome biogenesis GTPase